MEILCPLCRGVLTADTGGVICPQKHRFDRAKQGYLNLLPVQHKKSRQPGDDRAMVDGRRAFLNGGHYRPIAAAVAYLLSTHLSSPQPASLHSILDIGCGEGYYTAAMKEALRTGGIESDWAGIDISKEAVRAACSRDRETQWIVASAARIPLKNNNLNGMTALFTLLEPAEYARVLGPGAPLIVTTTGANHLLELRQKIYDNVRLESFDPAEKLKSHFTQIDRKEVQFSIHPEGEAIHHLLGMTPHVWRTSPERQRTLKSLKALSTQVDVLVTVYRKR